MNSQLFDFVTVPLLIFSFTMCVTPGPNNMMLAASGANFGYRRTLPHILGVLVGMNMLFLCAASGVAGLLVALPAVHWVFKICGTVYLLYFALKIAMFRAADDGMPGEGRTGRPISFVSASLFQFMNPKGLVIGLSTVSVFTAPGKNYAVSIAAILLTFNVVCIFTTLFWTGMGTIFQRKMKNARFNQIFNVSIGVLTASTVVFLLTA